MKQRLKIKIRTKIGVVVYFDRNYLLVDKQDMVRVYFIISSNGCLSWMEGLLQAI